MQESPRSTRRQQGQSLTDVVFGLIILALGCLAIDAMEVSTDLREANASSEQLAMALAAGQRDWIESLPYHEVLPTTGFQPVDWIQHPGLAPGQLPIETGTGASADAKLFSVRWKVEDADEWGSLRRIAVAVEWEMPNQKLGRVELNSLRAGIHADYASAPQRERRLGDRTDHRAESGSLL